jgi:tRNA-dihydrouridine synthase
LQPLQPLAWTSLRLTRAGIAVIILPMTPHDDHPPRIILAPLRGVTKRPYRTLFHERFGGVDLAVAPFVLAWGKTLTRRSLLGDVDPEREQAMPVVPQVIGGVPEDIATICRTLASMGHEEVNLNLGCPYRMVTKKRRGAGLLVLPDVVKEMLQRVHDDGRVRISIKTRLGLDAPTQFEALIPMLNGFPITEITIHPRVATQMYEGALDLDEFDRCARALAAPVIYNGDIRTRADYARLKARFPSVTGWMIGRGLVADPFLASAIRGDDDPTRDRLAEIRSFADDLLEAYRAELSGPAHVMDRMKELWTYLGDSFPGGERFRKKVHRTHSLSRYRRMVEEFLAPPPR